jgi:hypothetical protein
MVYDYCRRLFEFKQKVQPYTPPKKRGLGRGSEANVPQLKIKGPRSDASTVEPKVEVYEDAKDIFTSRLLWWKVPVGQEGLKNGDTHAPQINCQICDMIFSNASSSFVEVLLGKENGITFVYQLKSQNWTAKKSMIPEAVLSVWLESGDKLLPMIQLSIVAKDCESHRP